MSVVVKPSDRSLPTPGQSVLRIEWDDSVRPGVLAVSGPIDLSTQDQFHAALTWAARGGRMVVDLSGVTALNGRGIGLLHEHRADLAAVYVAEGSLIARALSYAGFSRWVPVLALGTGDDADGPANAISPPPRRAPG